MEFLVGGRTYTLWKDCAFCFLNGINQNSDGKCQHTKEVNI